MIVGDGDMTATELVQLVPRELERAQLIDAPGRVAAVEPFQGDQFLLPANGAAGLGDHELQRRAQARIVEMADQPVEIGSQFRRPWVRRVGGDRPGGRSLAVHGEASPRVLVGLRQQGPRDQMKAAAAVQ